METTVTESERLKSIVLNGTGHAFDTRTGRSYSLNPAAQTALLMLQDGATVHEVREALARLFKQPASVVEAGVERFAGQLRKYAK